MENYELYLLEGKVLKGKVKHEIISKLNQLGEGTKFELSRCIFSGGAISSLYHSEKVKDYDLWASNTVDIDRVKIWLDMNNYEEVESINDGEYADFASNFANGKIKSQNAITMKNGVQFITIDTYFNCRPKFDFVHCTPYYDIMYDKFYMSYIQWDSIRNKKLMVHSSDTDVKKAPGRIQKYQERGWKWP